MRWNIFRFPPVGDSVRFQEFPRPHNKVPASFSRYSKQNGPAHHILSSISLTVPEQPTSSRLKCQQFYSHCTALGVSARISVQTIVARAAPAAYSAPLTLLQQCETFVSYQPLDRKTYRFVPLRCSPHPAPPPTTTIPRRQRPTPHSVRALYSLRRVRTTVTNTIFLQIPTQKEVTATQRKITRAIS